MSEQEQIAQLLRTQEHLALKHEGASNNHDDAIFYSGKASAFIEAAVIIEAGIYKQNQ